MNGKEILEKLEEHCEEKIVCSKRLRFQIEESITRLIKQQQSLEQGIKNVLLGHGTYDIKTQKVINVKK